MAPARFDPGQFGDIAHFLVSAKPGEGGMRTAIGRLYYSLFLICLYHLYNGGLIPQKRFHLQPTHRKGIHAVIIDDMRRINTSVGDQLERLRTLRIQADYRLTADHGYSNWAANWRSAQFLAKSIRSGYERNGIKM